MSKASTWVSRTSRCMAMGLLMTAALPVVGASYPIKNGPTGESIRADLSESCDNVLTPDSRIVLPVNAKRTRALSTLSTNQKTYLYNALVSSTDPAHQNPGSTNLTFKFSGITKIGTYYADPTVPGPDGGVLARWDIGLYVRVFDNNGHSRQISYFPAGTAPAPTGACSIDLNDPACTQRNKDVAQQHLSGKSVINREQNQIITDDVTLGWIPQPILPAPLPVESDFYVSLSFAEMVYVEDAFHDLDGDSLPENDMHFLFQDLINSGVGGVGNYSIEIVIPGELEIRCEGLAGETDPILIFANSGAGEQTLMNFDTELAYLNF